MQTMPAAEFVGRLKSWIDEHGGSRFAFFLGAGCSVSSGIPAAGGLVREWLHRLQAAKRLTDEQWLTWTREHCGDWETNPGSHYGTVIEQLFTNPRLRQLEIERLTVGRDPGFGYATLAALMSHERYAPHCNVMLTTNFDDMVPDALYLYTNKKPLVIAHESLAGFMMASPERPLVVKLHGDARLEPKNTSVETQALKRAVVDAAGHLLHESRLVFIGYGGNDTGIAEMLRVLPANALGWGVYWVNDTLPGPATLQWLEERGAVWVAHRDFDELMLLIWKQFGLKHPDMSRYATPDEAYQSAYSKLELGVRATTVALAAAPADAEGCKAADNLASALSVASDALDWWKVQQEASKYKTVDPDRTDEIYRKGVEALPRSAELLGNYAAFLKNVRHDHDRAEERYRRALEAKPNYANGLGNLAGLLFSDGREAEARELLNRALSIDPHAPDLTLELHFYRYAHVPEDRDAALGELKRRLMAGDRSPGWDLSRNVEQAVAAGHPEPELLRKLAAVISDGAPLAFLEEYLTWRSA